MNLQGFTPYPRQKEVLDNIIQSDSLYHIMVNGRQSGKSTTLLGLILYYAINNPKFVVLYIPPTYNQISKIQTQIMDALDPTVW